MAPPQLSVSLALMDAVSANLDSLSGRIFLILRSLNNVKNAVGTNNSTVERLVVVMGERTTTLESEQQHQMLLQLTYQRVTMTSILESPRATFELVRTWSSAMCPSTLATTILTWSPRIDA